MQKRSFICFVFILYSSFLFAQNTDEQLAKQYADNKEYDKAIVIYSKLFDKTPSETLYYAYLNSLLEAKEYKTAEKVIKKQIKKNPENVLPIIDLAYLYQQENEPEKAKKQLESVVDNLPSNIDQIQLIANYFLKKKETDFAIKTYLKGRKILRGQYEFHFELAETYIIKNDTELMISELLETLSENEQNIVAVENTLQTEVIEASDSKKEEIIKTAILKKVQSSSRTVYSDLLIWFFTQKQDFESAFIQTKAIDKREDADGSRLISLARIALSNEKYDVAVKCYEYVITKGEKSYYYSIAKMELVNVLNQKITQTPNFTKNDILLLEKNYQSVLAEFGKNASTVGLIKSLAHLKTFYLNNITESILLLEEAIAMPKADAKTIAECKLELADILVFTGEMWESSLLYSQVEKSFKQEPIGQEAKFRNAKLSFYKGEFAWAQSQLDVLKASTSKLIANDALDLSLLIGDNTSLDSNLVPLQLYANAYLLSYRNLDSLALITLDSIITIYPLHSIIDEVLYKKYQIEKKRKYFEKAAEYLTEIKDKYATDIYGDDAVFYLAELNEKIFKNNKKAQQLYEDVITTYPGSIYAVDARKRYRNLRGDKITN